ncbi:hypothetical protein [Halolamina salifodinae]|uniref:Uncharacterized protein n=1 Tax=Halolamina salifodinae TaxID=1202767 RepID=A0A8T4GVX7_9EURY|nr:hypothetical protein [Halolamina salifodinae]MBP1986272.1 hypothetical protein [Halolamina salifodinae]
MSEESPSQWERDKVVLREMFREEWRLHSELLGGGRFGAFPLLVVALVAGAVWLLDYTGTDPGAVVAGLHALAFVFGLHTGSIGFVGRDAMENVLGEVTLVVFSARTLPLSQGRLLAIFVLKDVVYYAGLFLLPMAVGVAPAALAEGGFGLATIPLLWVTLVTTFVLGIGLTIAGVGLSAKGLPGRALLLGLTVGAAVAAWYTGVPVIAYTPYGLYQDPGLVSAVTSAVLILAAFAVGAATFDPAVEAADRSVGPDYRRWLARVDDPVAAKTLLDVHRSSGGFGKVLFSAAVLLGVTAGLVDLAADITGVAPSVGVSFGAVLGLTGFTTYNWLTTNDDVESYLAHPLDAESVFHGKLRAFLLLGPAVGLAFYAVGVAWRGTPLGEAIVGAVVLVGVACYVFGLTIYLAGMSPNEFLFDTGLYAAFGAAVAIPLVPILVVAFALAPVSTGLLAPLGVGGVVLGGAGIGLYRRSLPKWGAYHRE